MPWLATSETRAGIWLFFCQMSHHSSASGDFDVEYKSLGIIPSKVQDGLMVAEKLVAHIGDLEN
jgi:hypothetical protein